MPLIRMFASNDLFLQRLERNAEKSLNDSCLPFQLPLRFLGQLSQYSNAVPGTISFTDSFSDLYNDVGHVLQLFTFSDVHGVDYMVWGGTLVKDVTGSVTGGRVYIILISFSPLHGCR